MHHITSLPCSRPSHGSHITPRKGKLLTTLYCPSNLISYLFLLSPSLPPSSHNDHLALPQTCLTTTYRRAFALADPSTWKTLLPKLYPTHHHFIQVSNLTSSEKPCQLAPHPLTLLYFSPEHLLLSEILAVCLLICCLFSPSEYKPHQGRGLALLTIWHIVGIQSIFAE